MNIETQTCVVDRRFEVLRGADVTVVLLVVLLLVEVVVLEVVDVDDLVFVEYGLVVVEDVLVESVVGVMKCSCLLESGATLGILDVVLGNF